MPAKRSLIFCATQRTGSALVYDDFFRLNGGPSLDAERPYTLLFRENVATWDDLWMALGERNVVADHVVIKVMFHYLPHLSQFIAGVRPANNWPIVTFEPRQCDAFFQFFEGSQWAHIEREDVCAQIVSLFMAEKSHIWENRTGEARPEAPADAPIPYDRERLLKLARRILAERPLWRAFFAHYGITPLVIKYEDAAANYPGYLDELQRAMGLTSLSPCPPRRMFKVGGETHRDYAQRLRADLMAALGPEALLVG